MTDLDNTMWGPWATFRDLREMGHADPPRDARPYTEEERTAMARVQEARRRAAVAVTPAARRRARERLARGLERLRASIPE